MESLEEWNAKKEARRAQKEGRKNGNRSSFGNRSFSKGKNVAYQAPQQTKREIAVEQAAKLGTGPNAEAYGCKLKPEALARLRARFGFHEGVSASGEEQEPAANHKRKGDRAGDESPAQRADKG